MGSFLVAGITRLLRALIKSHAPPLPPPTASHQTSAESYQQLLAAALSPEHPLHIRHQLPSQLINDLLTPEAQLVKFSAGAILESNHEPTYVVNDIIRPSSPADPVTTALNDCDWDSRLVQTGFDWTTPSVWYIPLDILLLSFEVLDTHFRLVATLSSPDSRAVLLYPTREVVVNGFTLEQPCEDMRSFLKLSGFDVESVQALADVSDAADAHVPQYEQYLKAMTVAVVRPAHRAPTQPTLDSISEVTYMSNDISSQTASTEFEDCMSLDRRLVRFELEIAGLPAHLAVPENQIVVIGSGACVGCWNPTQAKRMIGRIDIPGALVADVSVGVIANDFEYKYAVVRGDEVIEWESGSNRCLTEDTKISKDEWRCS